jgi:hypothetical protein
MLPVTATLKTIITKQPTDATPKAEVREIQGCK